jgi:tetratricopeptide (TPR) repeat protein
LILVAAATVFAVLPVLADAWYVRGRPELSVKVDPLQAQYHWALGENLLARGDLAGGTLELQRAADLGETEPGLYVELGDRQAQLGNRLQARADYRRALVIDPFYTPAQQRLAALGA